MNRKIMEAVAPEALKRVDKGLCLVCEKPVKREDMKNKISLKEFDLSGMCQSCQDNFFE